MSRETHFSPQQQQQQQYSPQLSPQQQFPGAPPPPPQLDLLYGSDDQHQPQWPSYDQQLSPSYGQQSPYGEHGGPMVMMPPDPTSPPVSPFNSPSTYHHHFQQVYNSFMVMQQEQQYPGSYGGYEQQQQQQQQQQQEQPIEQPIAWESLQGRVKSFCLTRQGARAVQAHISDEVIRQAVFLELAGSISRISRTQDGAMLLQQMIELGPRQIRTDIWAEISAKPGGFKDLCVHKSGVSLAQTMIDNIECPQQVSLLHAGMTAEDVCNLFKDSTGAHILLRCIHALMPKDSRFIFVAAADQLLHIGRHKFGCTILQKALEASMNDTALQLMIAERVAAIGPPLVWDAYGNYIVQHVLKLNEPAAFVYKTTLFEKLQGQMMKLATHKFGSNVAEQIVQCCPEGLAIMLKEICEARGLESLVTHPFGNYVVQRIISKCTNEQLSLLGNRINEFASVSDKVVASTAPTAPEKGKGGRGKGKGSNKPETFRRSAHGRNIIDKLCHRQSEIEGKLKQQQ